MQMQKLRARHQVPVTNERILQAPRPKATGPECARPRAQQCSQAVGSRKFPACWVGRKLLHPRTGALRWHGQDARGISSRRPRSGFAPRSCSLQASPSLVGAGCVRAACSPSPQPSPLGRGSILASQLANPTRLRFSRARLRDSLSPRERAGVRGKVTSAAPRLPYRDARMKQLRTFALGLRIS